MKGKRLWEIFAEEEGTPPPITFEDMTHELMNQSLGGIVGLLERHGYDPCPAIRVAHEIMEPAWNAWNLLVTELRKGDATNT